MDVKSVLQKLVQADVKLSLKDGNIIWDAPSGAPIDGLLELIRKHKKEIIGILSDDASSKFMSLDVGPENPDPIDSVTIVIEDFIKDYKGPIDQIAHIEVPIKHNLSKNDIIVHLGSR
jgi:hypothetical protein